ncbi:hypothetical protein BN844_3934 [Pseudomonas sp. SHC52]|nr:hypothetical protein BN844_3934 [Pseudomonas sp. SHC52]
MNLCLLDALPRPALAQREQPAAKAGEFQFHIKSSAGVGL